MPNDGGIHAKRGFEFEAQSLLNYLLIRMMTGETISITFEKGQDATFFYPEIAGRSQIIELVQCKKREHQPAGAGHVAIPGWDSWSYGEFGITDVAEWLRKPTDEAPIPQLLENSAYRYTALVYGACAKSITRLMPDQLRRPSIEYDPLTIAQNFSVNFEHAMDPDPRGKLGRGSSARRMRLVPLPNPYLLEALSENILRKHFGVKPDSSRQVFEALLARVKKAAQASDETNRQFGSAEASQLIAKGLYTRGAWQDGADLLKKRSMLG